MFDILLAILAIPIMRIFHLLKWRVEIDENNSSKEEIEETKETKETKETTGKAMILQKDDVWNAGTRDSVLQILANLVYNRFEFQEKVRTSGGIELVLNHTKIHPKHPLHREWALFTVFFMKGNCNK